MIDGPVAAAAFLLVIGAIVVTVHRLRERDATVEARPAFPFAPSRLLLVAVAWNASFWLDRQWLGFADAGPFAGLSLLGLGAIGLTAPFGRYPGRWILRHPALSRTWSLVSGWAGAIALLLLAFLVAETIASDRPKLPAPTRGVDPPKERAGEIAAYRGYSDGSQLWVRGRVLEGAPRSHAERSDSRWSNLVASFKRWESDEVPGIEVELEHLGSTRTVRTDDEGYYEAEIALDDKAPATTTVTAQVRLEGQTLTATHRVTSPGENARFVVVSDLDDTVIVTELTHLPRAAKRTILGNAATRESLPGVSRLYRSLAGGENGADNPVFYLSDSSWNLYDLLSEFLTLHTLPPGPLLLRDLGIAARTSDHKVQSLSELLRRFDTLPFVLLGDSGQHDAATYSAIAREYRSRIRAIYIRDVDPEVESDHDAEVDRIISENEDLGIPFLRLKDSEEIARHAAKIGLISEGNGEAD